MHIRFADLVNLNVPRWVIQPFSADPADLKVELQDQFIDFKMMMTNSKGTMKKIGIIYIFRPTIRAGFLGLVPVS